MTDGYLLMEPVDYSEAPQVPVADAARIKCVAHPEADVPEYAYIGSSGLSCAQLYCPHHPRGEGTLGWYIIPKLQG